MPTTRTVTVVAVLASSACLALVPAASAQPCSNARTSLSSLAGRDARVAVLCQINARRAAARLVAMAPDSALGRAAGAYARDMVAGDYFAHVSSDGRTVVDRAAAAGWNGSKLSETIVFAQAPLDTAVSIVRMWMNSPPHRAVLMDRSLRRAGIGLANGCPNGSAVVGSTAVLDAGRR